MAAGGGGKEAPGVAQRLAHINAALPSSLNGNPTLSFGDCQHARTGWQGPTDKDAEIPHQEFHELLPAEQLSAYEAEGYTYRARGSNG